MESADAIFAQLVSAERQNPLKDHEQDAGDAPFWTALPNET